MLSAISQVPSNAKSDVIQKILKMKIVVAVFATERKSTGQPKERNPRMNISCSTNVRIAMTVAGALLVGTFLSVLTTLLLMASLVRAGQRRASDD